MREEILKEHSKKQAVFISDYVGNDPGRFDALVELFFDKEKMLNGVNIVTLFRNYQPVAERKFFINKRARQTAILIDHLISEITYTLLAVQLMMLLLVHQYSTSGNDRKQKCQKMVN